MIWLIGPGGAGKSTVGPLLAQRLSIPFCALDVEFAARFRDIDDFISSLGCSPYAHSNVEAYELVVQDRFNGVMAVSSGFVTYPLDAHPRYAAMRHEIARSPTTFVLLPSIELGTCLAETVRRQVARPLTPRMQYREELVSCERFRISSLHAEKVETMRPPADVAAEIVARLRQA